MRIARLAGRPVLLTPEGAIDVPDRLADDVFARWDDILAWSPNATGARPYDPADLLIQACEERDGELASALIAGATVRALRAVEEQLEQDAERARKPTRRRRAAVS